MDRKIANHIRIVVFACVGFAVALAHAQTGNARVSATPPMGWNSWNHYRMGIDDALIRAQADAMVASGMRDAGYTYINIDEGWEGTRDEQGNLRPNKKFPDMKTLTEYVHSKGLKIGIYSSPGPKACGGSEGSYGHEEQDAKQFAAWGFNYLKYDWCSAGRNYKPAESPEAFRKMSQALLATGRPMVYSIHGHGAVWRYGASVGANLWRTGSDIKDNYARMLAIGFGQNGLERFAGTGHWNDPDMLEVGNGGMTDSEYRMHFSLWCLLAAPLIAGNDLTNMSAETRTILTNRELIAVDQDPAGIQGHSVYEEGPIEIIAKPLADGSRAVGIFNREQGTVSVTLKFSDISAPEKASFRDLWQHKDLGAFTDSYTVDVAQHAVVMLRVQRAVME